MLGHLPIYDFEDEDLAVSDDGTTALLTEFTANSYLHAVDVSDPRLPVITDTIVGQGPHTVMCANDACTHLYGSNGRTFDVSNRADIKIRPVEQGWGRQVGVGGGHNVHRDAAGVFVSDTNPLTVFRQLDGDPTRIEKLAEGRISLNSNVQHNNIRPRADRYVPRAPEAGLDGPLRDGELLLGNGETHFTRTCAGNAGAFSTWSMAGFDQRGLGENGFGADMQQLDVLRPVSGDVEDGDAPVNGLGCSATGSPRPTRRTARSWCSPAGTSTAHASSRSTPRPGRPARSGSSSPCVARRRRPSSCRAARTASTSSGRSTSTPHRHPALHRGRRARADDRRAGRVLMLRAGHTDVFSIAMRELCQAGDDATSAQRAAAHHALPAPVTPTVSRVQRAALPTF